MARIIGGIGTSHVPTIGVAYDKGKQQDPAWKPLFDGIIRQKCLLRTLSMHSVVV